jgi:hypothetical protein
MKQRLLIFAFSVMALALGFDFMSTANPIEGLLAVGAVTSAMAQASPVGLSPLGFFVFHLPPSSVRPAIRPIPVETKNGWQLVAKTLPVHGQKNPTWTPMGI